MPASATISITGADKGSFEMEYEDVGIFEYEIRQQKGTNEQCTYDETVYTLTVYVTVDEEFNRELTTVMFNDKGEKVEEAIFTNTYKPLEPAKYDPPVQKLVVNNRGTAPANSVFTFAMIPAQKDYPMPDNTEARRDASTSALYMDKTGPGAYEFGWMTFEQKDVGKTYVYTVREMPGSDTNYTYDVQIYTMTVKVTSKDGKVVLDVSYTDKSGNPVGTAVFTNTYNPPFGPKTGDNSNLVLWGSLLGVSAVGIAIALILLKRKKRK